MKIKNYFCFIAFFALACFFSCKSSEHEIACYDMKLRLVSDGEPLTGTEREFALRPLEDVILESEEDEKKKADEKESVAETNGEPEYLRYLFTPANEDGSEYSVTVAEGLYRLFEENNDLHVFVKVGAGENLAVLAYCSSFADASDALKDISAPSGLGVIVTDRDITALGYDNLLQRSVASSQNPVSLDIRKCTRSTLGFRAFYGCSSLCALQLPDSVTSFPKECFAHCSNLRYLNVGPGVKSIEGGAFISCENLSTISVSPSNRNYIVENSAIYLSDKKTLVAWPSAKGDIAVSADLITAYAFAGCPELTSVNIDCVSIQPNAFQNCASLQSVFLGKRVEDVRENAFIGSKSLTSISVEDGNTTYSAKDGMLLSKEGLRLFAWPSAQGSVTLPQTINRVEDNAFFGQKGLVSVYLPPQVREVGHQAFAECSDLSSVNMPGIVNIESYAFSKCPKLASVNLPDSLRRCDGSAFSECGALTTINVASGNSQYRGENGAIFSADGKTLIEWPAASGVITIPATVETIGTYAFNRCTSLEEVTMTSVVTVGHHAFDGCLNLKTVNLSESVRTIGSHAFSNCLSVENLVIPESVQVIKNYAFWFWGKNQTISAKAKRKPAGWDFAWNADCEAAVKWGVK
ncbi:MAG TPA: hypothetical protein DCM57_05005 [Treponema sp.]|nr:hypothetical protein [Treponema sp.]HBB42927.1 hypothetical protein [Treponema sp.]